MQPAGVGQQMPINHRRLQAPPVYNYGRAAVQGEAHNMAASSSHPPPPPGPPPMDVQTHGSCDEGDSLAEQALSK